MSKYVVVDAESASALENRANMYLERGYRPIGSLTVTNYNGKLMFYQPMMFEGYKPRMAFSSEIVGYFNKEEIEDAHAARKDRHSF